MREPDSKDTGEKPWPTLDIARRDDAPQLGHWETSRLHAEGHGMEVETFVPLQVIRERLKDPKLIDALCRATDRNEEWETDVTDHTPEGEEIWDRVEAALDAAFSKEEGS